MKDVNRVNIIPNEGHIMESSFFDSVFLAASFTENCMRCHACIGRQRLSLESSIIVV